MKANTFGGRFASDLVGHTGTEVSALRAPSGATPEHRKEVACVLKIFRGSMHNRGRKSVQAVKMRAVSRGGRLGGLRNSEPLASRELTAGTDTSCLRTMQEQSHATVNLASIFRSACELVRLMRKAVPLRPGRTEVRQRIRPGCFSTKLLESQRPRPVPASPLVV